MADFTWSPVVDGEFGNSVRLKLNALGERHVAMNYLLDAVAESNQPVNAKWMMKIYDTDPQYRDNIITLGNESRVAVADPGDGRTHNMGNAAIRIVAGDQREVAAFGFSALKLGDDAMHPTTAPQYYAHLSYWEVSDLSGGAISYGPPDWAVVVTNIAGNVHFPDTSFRPFEHHSNIGETFIRARRVGSSAPGMLFIDAEAQFGDDLGQPVGAAFAGYSTRLRLRERDGDDFFALTTNVDGGTVKDNDAKTAWRMSIGYGAGADRIAFGRMAVGETVWKNFLTINGDGSVDVGGIANPRTFKLGGFSAFMRAGERYGDDLFTLSTNSFDDATKDDAARAAWQILMGPGSIASQDTWQVRRSAAGSGTFTKFLGFDNAGIMSLNLASVGNYANDAAAAAASVPVGSVYRNGSVMMIRAA